MADKIAEEEKQLGEAQKWKMCKSVYALYLFSATFWLSVLVNSKICRLYGYTRAMNVA